MLEGLYITGIVWDFLRILPGCISHPALDSLQHFSCKCLIVVIKAEYESANLDYSVNSSGEVGYLFMQWLSSSVQLHEYLKQYTWEIIIVLIFLAMACSHMAVVFSSCLFFSVFLWYCVLLFLSILPSFFFFFPGVTKGNCNLYEMFCSHFTCFIFSCWKSKAYQNCQHFRFLDWFLKIIMFLGVDSHFSSSSPISHQNFSISYPAFMR